ncbi:hypothetical protein [Achromobacter kerstersii]|uniref:hypothetical protein n=1 Tax=Achromobacter kerstersii TaxID=1353890 RepID=UPI003CFE5BCF
MKTLVIGNETQAIAAIEKALSEEGFSNDIVELKFDNWPILEIVLEGPGYKSTITPDMAKALVELQRALNRTFARYAHGEASAIRLTDKERQDIQFKAKVEDGCSLIKVDLGEFAGKLATAVADKLTPEMLVASVVGVAVVAGSTMAYKAYLSARTKDKEIESGDKTKIALSAQETRRLEVVAGLKAEVASIRPIEQDFDDVRDDIVRGISDATSLEVNGVEITRETALTAAKTLRVRSSDGQANGTYYVDESSFRNPHETRIMVRNASTQQVFPASFKDSSLKGTQIQLLKDAAFARTRVYLSINTKERRGEIVSAQIVGVKPQPKNAPHRIKRRR